MKRVDKISHTTMKLGHNPEKIGHKAAISDKMTEEYRPESLTQYLISPEK